MTFSKAACTHHTCIQGGALWYMCVRTSLLAAVASLPALGIRWVEVDGSQVPALWLHSAIAKHFFPQAWSDRVAVSAGEASLTHILTCSGYWNLTPATGCGGEAPVRGPLGREGHPQALSCQGPS